MKPSELLGDFFGRALASGQSRNDIAAALRSAGWMETEVARAMEAWADVDFAPPVPRPRSYVSAREAFVYGTLFTALAFAVFYINSLGFALIEQWLAEPSDNDTWRSNSLTREIRWSIAFLVVTVPLFLWLNRRQALAIGRDPASKRSALRKWFGYVMLFFALLGLAGALVTTIYTLLDGEMTLRFALKAGLVLVTAGLTFVYYRGQTEDADAA
jgi:Domain of unknown function (DUF5671)